MLQLMWADLSVVLQLMWADVSVAHMLSFVNVLEIDFDLDAYPKLTALKQEVESHPKIAEWIESRPDSRF